MFRASADLVRTHLVPLFLVVSACNGFLAWGQSSSAASQTTSHTSAFEELKPYHLIGTIPLPSLKKMSGRLGFDQQNGRLFFSDGKDLVIVNSDSGERVGLVPKIRGVSSIAFAPEIHRVFILNSDSRDLFVLDLTALTIVRKANAGAESSSILYDSATKKILATGITSSTCKVFDAVSGEQVGTVKLRGYPLRAVGDAYGHVYFELTSRSLGTLLQVPGTMSPTPTPLKSDLAELDTRMLAMGERWQEESCPYLVLLGIDRSGQNLVTGCKNSITLLNLQTRKTIGSSAIGGVKVSVPVTFNPDFGDAFLVGVDAQTTPYQLELIVVHEDSSGQLDPAELVPQVFGRPAAFDAAAQHFFVVQSDTKTVDSGLFIEAPGSGLTPLPVQEPVPGTYQILVYGRD